MGHSGRKKYSYQAIGIVIGLSVLFLGLPAWSQRNVTDLSETAIAISSTPDLLEGQPLRQKLEATNVVKNSASNPTILLEELESLFTEEFSSYLNLDGQVSSLATNIPAVQTTLKQVASATGIKPGVLYVYFSSSHDHPNNQFQDAATEHPDDVLGVFLITQEGQPIHKELTSVTRRDVMPVAEEFYAQVTNAISGESQYLPPAQQLYNWFIKPIETELQAQGIESLAFAMGCGLRVLPLAALHNGSEFLIERYSLGLIPSIRLTNFDSENFISTPLENTQLLAMGASEFPSQQALPAVSQELDIIAQTFNNSDVFLNEEFTLRNLQQQIAQERYDIVHLASHGVFSSGEPHNSYIQLWDQPLQMNRFHTLGLMDSDIALMVLSACNTAFGDLESEYGFAGLAVNLGIQTALASLWPISDEGTLGVMSYFYDQLKQQPVRATALRQAQLTMLQGDLQFVDGTLYGVHGTPLAHFPEQKYSGRWTFEHPFYWSTYTLVGSPW